jgi:deoxycytidylate deaminase
MVNEWDSFLEDDPENEDRDGLYLCDVWNMASQHSQDPNTQVAAALVSWAGGVVLAGWNEVPPQLLKSGYPKSIQTKNFCTEHAERRVLFKANQNRLPTNRLQMYGTWISCSECARAIIQFEIKRVVTFRRLVEKTPPKWKDSVREGLTMLRDAGIQVVGWNGTLNTSRSILFNGQLLTPTDVL